MDERQALLAAYTDHFQRAFHDAANMSDEELRNLNRSAEAAGVTPEERLELIGQALAQMGLDTDD